MPKAMDTATKRAKLKRLKAEIDARKDLPLTEGNLVFGEGNPDCDVMFIGEAPGAEEDRCKVPFVGACGELLDEHLEKIDWKRSDVYISNIVKRRPPENRRPRRGEIEAYRPYLTREIEIINPKVVVTLGRFSTNCFLGDAKMKCVHGRAFNIDGRIILPVYHPGAALRSTEIRNLFQADMEKVPKVVNGELKVEIPKAVTNLPSSMARPKAKKGGAIRALLSGR